MTSWATVTCAALLTSLAVAAGCTKKNPDATCANGVCLDPKYPFCDTDGVISGTPNSCVAVSCAPMAFQACDGSQAITCDSSGSNYGVAPCPNGCSAGAGGCNACVPSSSSCGSGALITCDSNGEIAETEACQLGCVDAPTPHCTYISPRYLPNICDTPSSTTFTIALSSTFDTDDDSNCTNVVAQTGAPGLCVVHAQTITIEANKTLQVISSLNQPVGTGSGRGFALVADGDLLVLGAIDLSGSGLASGPGASGVTSGGTILGGGTPTGGGGAGFQQAGGAGANASSDGGADNGGAATTDPALLLSLIGGYPNGGGGGGGMTLISCHGTVNVSGLIAAGGGGAQAVYTILGTPEPGPGGGAGGYVVLQGMNVVVTGQMYANGGGGAAGVGPANSNSSQDGQDGTWSDTTPASGGAPQTGGGAGGNGGIYGTIPQSGKHPTNSSYNPGGGGGSIGFFQTYTPTGVTPTLTPSHASPQFQPNATIPTR